MKLTGAVFMAFLGRRAIAVDSTRMAVIVAPGARVDDRVAVLPSQVARPRAATDQVGPGDRVLRRLRKLVGLIATRTGKCLNDAESNHDDDNDVEPDERVDCGFHDRDVRSNGRRNLSGRLRMSCRNPEINANSQNLW